MGSPSRLYKNGAYICVLSPDSVGSFLMCQTCSVVTTASTNIPIIWFKQCQEPGLFSPSLKFNIPATSIVGEVNVIKREKAVVELDPSEIPRLLKLNERRRDPFQTKTKFISNKLEKLYKSINFQSDLVLICSDDERVFVHRAILSLVSPMMRSLLIDQKIHDPVAFISVDHESCIVRKMIKIAYTGKAVLSKHEDIKSVKEALNCLGIDINHVSVASDTCDLVEEERVGTAEVFKNHVSSGGGESISNGDDIIASNPINELDVLKVEDTEIYERSNINNNRVQYENDSMSISPQRFSSDCETRQVTKKKNCRQINGHRKEKEENYEVQVEQSTLVSNPKFNLASALKAYVQLRPSDKVGKRKTRSVTDKFGDVTVERKPKYQSFRCQDCSKSFKLKGKLIKHQVDEHYYEDLENLLIGEFLEAKVCSSCNVNFSSFDTFIRHKADIHGTVNMVLTKKAMPNGTCN